MHPGPRLPTRLGIETREQIASEIAWSMNKLTEHLPRSNRTVEIVKDCSRRWSECASAPLQDGRRVEHRSDG
jgi:hypothetical protein